MEKFLERNSILNKFYNLKYRNTIATILFWFGISLEILIMIVNYSVFDLTITGRIRQLTFLCFGLKILLTKYNLKEWMIIGIIGVLGITSYVTMDTKYLIYISVMIFASKGMDSTKVLRYIFYASLAGMILVIVLSLTGIGGPIYDIRDYGRGTIEKRWTVGFNHANNLHGTFW